MTATGGGFDRIGIRPPSAPSDSRLLGDLKRVINLDAKYSYLTIAEWQVWGESAVAQVDKPGAVLLFGCGLLALSWRL